MNMIKKVVPTTDIEVCSACLSTELDNVFDMPALPHIGIYLDDKSKAGNFPRVDNGLNICRKCGHVQLHKAVSPEFLYDETFTHRTSDSPTASAANLEYSNYIKKLAGDRKFKRAIEVGCNDAFFLKSLAGVYDHACGVDPVWKNREHLFGDSLNDTEKQSISVIGDFVENADFEARIGGAPDLITSSFVFEHIKEPVKVLESLFSLCDDDALFVINVPGSDMLFNDARFDQLSHQHYQQFTLHSFIKMVEVAGGEYIDHNIYYSVWGAIMVAFKKRKSDKFESAADKFRKADLELVQNSKKRFDALLDCSKQAVTVNKGQKVFGFGAAQNFPTLAYFLQDVSFLECILDDNPARQNRYYPWPDIETKVPDPDYDFSNDAMFLTGPDYGRALINRAKGLGFERVITPVGVV